MNLKRNYYKILAVDPSADAAEIKEAYKKLVKRWHPDLNDNSIESRQMMKDINEAYEVLSNETMRAEYNRLVFGSAYARQAQSRTHSFKEPSEEQKARVRKNYENRYKDAGSYYSNFEKNIEEGQKDVCTGAFLDKFHLLRADASYLPSGIRFFITPFLFGAAVFWHGVDLISIICTAFCSLFMPQKR